jgi:hypothetical protein
MNPKNKNRLIMAKKCFKFWSILRHDQTYDVNLVADYLADKVVMVL